MKSVKIIGIVLGVFVLVGLGLIFFIKHPALVSVVDENNLPQFIQADFIDLSRITNISKFRSSAGHDFSGHGETCRSMKHYFNGNYDPTSPGYKDGDPPPPAPDPTTAVPIFSPVDGRIISISAEHTPIGEQFAIRPDGNPSYTIRLFHVFRADGVKALQPVKAGQRIGSLGKGLGTDIAVQVGTLIGDQFVSYFQVMPDTIFAHYISRGAKSRSDFILTKAERDAKPLACNGEQFAQNYQSVPGYDEEVHLSGYALPDYGQQPGGQSNQTQNCTAPPCSSTRPVSGH